LADADIDEFAFFQIQCSSLVFSYGTALYVWGFTDIIPHTFDISVPQGAVIRLYDKERCLCDLIKDRNQIEKQLYIQAIKDYFKNRPDVRKLLKYGKTFGIEEKIRTYMEVL